MNDREILLDQLIGRLPTGREHAISARDLSAELGISRRQVGQLVAQAILEDGYCIGSLCGEQHGYYLVRDAADLEAGVGHTVRRAISSFRHVRALQRNYEAMPNAEQTSLFAELEAV